MDYNAIEIVKLWKQTAHVLGGSFSMPKQKINGGNMAGGMFLFGIEFIYRGLEINIHTGLYEFPLQKNEYNDCDIIITAKKAKKERVELSIWRKDYFDKIFGSSGRKTGYKEFDKRIGLKPSKNIEKSLSSIFKNEDLRNELIADKYRSYNLKTVDNCMTLERKSGVRVSSQESMENEFHKFSLLLDGLINGKVF
ncbi:hypothetical protein GCQ56_07890 [Marinifilum sp. N1E240]|uniref:hypothetical protein n=1 Tax=Marinifilum sp. N1E240 TaxID=2608082 RepID=UPI00128C981E|nr:hypothetical protein [Marinifilum sp. N1E240]MPQ46935.1 hypothetical protein [Marinifilum sp. N1E240]